MGNLQQWLQSWWQPHKYRIIIIIIIIIIAKSANILAAELMASIRFTYGGVTRKNITRISSHPFHHSAIGLWIFVSKI